MIVGTRFGAADCRLALITVCDAQFNRCYSVFSIGSSNFKLRNALCYQIGTLQYQNCGSCTPATLSAENVTIHSCTNFISAITNASVALTNCLLVQVTNLGPATITTNSSFILSSDTGVFQTAGAGAHYLAAGSPYRGAGTSAVNPALLAELKLKTTYPPIIISNQLYTANITYSPQASRDSGGANLDVGWHYDPLDFLITYIRVTNSSALVAAGTAVGTGGLYGIAALAGGTLTLQGVPTNLVRMVRYTLVQEHANTNYDAIGPSLHGDWIGGATPAQVSASFTDFSMPAQESSHYDSSTLYTNNVSFSQRREILGHRAWGRSSGREHGRGKAERGDGE